MTGFRRCLAVLLVAFVNPVLAQSQDDGADVKRLVDALQLKRGSIVCELGVGTGALTLAMATQVGDRGHVYANELNADRLKDVERAIREAHLTNVTLVEGQETRTNLPDRTCDAIFMRNVYHHFADPPTMNASVLQSLKPGGRVAVIDFSPRGSEATVPSDRDEDGHHGVSATSVAAELTAARFDVLSSDARGNAGFIVVARKP